MKKYCFIFIALLSCNVSHKPKYKPDKEVLEIVANQLYETGAFRQAKLCYDTLITLDQNNPKYYYRRGYCHMVFGEFDAAKPDFIATTKLNYADKATSFAFIGEINRAQGNFDSAIYYYDQCLKIDSGYARAKEGKKEALRKNSNL